MIKKFLFKVRLKFFDKVCCYFDDVFIQRCCFRGSRILADSYYLQSEWTGQQWHEKLKLKWITRSFKTKFEGFNLLMTNIVDNWQYNWQYTAVWRKCQAKLQIEKFKQSEGFDITLVRNTLNTCATEMIIFSRKMKLKETCVQHRHSRRILHAL